MVGARAALEQIELEVANTTLVAPFDAVLQERDVEVGDYVSSGDRIAQLVDTDPIIVVGEVSERQIHELAVGNTGHAKLVSGQPIEGKVRYVAPVAEPSTRTFRVELAVPNADRRACAPGMTAELRVATDDVTVHVLSPALLSLDETGAVGVKSVDAQQSGRVPPGRDRRARATRASRSAGLPDGVQLIIVGHGFVRTGDLVDPVDDAAARRRHRHARGARKTRRQPRSMPVAAGI